MPSVDGVVETSLYVKDLGASSAFYRRLFEFPVLYGDERAVALNVSDRQVLLLFQQGASRDTIVRPGGSIPGHHGSGSLHLAFGITHDDLAPWRSRLVDARVPIEAEMRWERGGISLYFRDPDQHLIELLTPGVWAIR